MQESAYQQSLNLKNNKMVKKKKEQKLICFPTNSLQISQLQFDGATLNILQNRTLGDDKQRKSALASKKVQISRRSSGVHTNSQANDELQLQNSKTFPKLKSYERISSKKQVKQINSVKSQGDTRALDTNSAGKQRQIWQKQVTCSLKFKQEHPEFCKGDLISFPIQDKLFDVGQYQIQPFYIQRNDIRAQYLSNYFQSLLEVWNTLKTFSEYFLAANTQFTLQQAQQLILEDARFIEIVAKILDVFLKDFTNEKNQITKKSKYFDFFNLLRFCYENSLMDKIYKRCWPTLFYAIWHLLQSGNQNAQDIWIGKVLKQLIFKGKQNLPSKLIVRCKILAFFCELLTQTTQFRRMVTQKGEVEKKQHKKQLQLDQKKKKILKEISKANQQYKESLKQQKTFNKTKTSQELNDHKNNGFQNLSRIQQVRTKKAQLILKLNKIQDQIKQLETTKTVLTCVELLGQDKQRNNYWAILASEDKIFVSSNDGKWGYYMVENIENLIGNLNLRGYRESCLYRTLFQRYDFQNLNSIKNKTDLTFLKQSYNTNQAIQEAKSNEETIAQQMAFLLSDSQKRLNQYLQQRNSRWGTEAERQNFYIFISRLHEESIPSILDFLRVFNQKICVVQTQYRRINQQSAEELDTKTRKVQTKIWGISQKYKTHWTQFSLSIQQLSGLFFLVYVLCLNIEKYTSKNRKKRKEFEIVKEHNKYFKTTSCRKDDLAWEQVCEECKEGGELLCCDMCPKVYHLACLDLASSPDDKFVCNDCNKSRNIRKLLRKSKD